MSRLTLQQRLRAHVGRRIAIEAPGFASEAGLLQAVGPTFIRVSGQFFVPSTANQLRLLQIPTNVVRLQLVSELRIGVHFRQE